MWSMCFMCLFLLLSISLQPNSALGTMKPQSFGLNRRETNWGDYETMQTCRNMMKHDETCTSNTGVLTVWQLFFFTSTSGAKESLAWILPGDCTFKTIQVAIQIESWKENWHSKAVSFGEMFQPGWPCQTFCLSLARSMEVKKQDLVMGFVKCTHLSLQEDPLLLPSINSSEMTMLAVSKTTLPWRHRKIYSLSNKARQEIMNHKRLITTASSLETLQENEKGREHKGGWEERNWRFAKLNEATGISYFRTSGQKLGHNTPVLCTRCFTVGFFRSAYKIYKLVLHQPTPRNWVETLYPLHHVSRVTTHGQRNGVRL